MRSPSPMTQICNFQCTCTGCRKRARNQLQCHPVLELSTSVHKRFLEAGKLYIDLQKVAVYDQSPLVQCAKCLGFGHTKAVFGEKTATCSYCADKTHESEKFHVENKTRNRNARTAERTRPKLRPTTRPLATNTRSRHKNGSDDLSKSPEIQSGDCRITPTGDRERDIDSLDSGTLCKKRRHPKTKSRHQSNTVHCRPPEASESSDNCFRRQSKGFTGPTTSHGNRIDRPIKIGRMKLGIISIYFEGDEDIEPYIIRIKKACKNLGTENLIIAGDINAWSYWWGSQREYRRGQAYRDLLDEMGFHILNTGSTPTFETYRGDRICSSIVDVTACSSPLIGRVENWRVDRTATTSDHNAIVSNLRLSGPIKPMEPITTRRYNTNKVDWTEFCLQLRNTLQKYGIAENVEQTKRPEDLEANSREYTATIQEVCEEIFPKIGQRNKAL
ncbi:hypothetical protein EVAR_102482_1 [Eumeta japonica]|uniref:Endonuclease/exonuclease/phosphatase domain-containing protein n=1 Tax=Eumeta variegata TaxID=151549 RepID=A0A4C1ZS67_EUMVA|nr:hypothetical protein EVAR_102482_1 [Eumeta japonica]